MDDLLYPGTLLLLAVLAFVLNQNNSPKLALLAILVGIYVVYSHETGHTVTEFKNEMVQSVVDELDDTAENYKFDEEKIEKKVE